MSPFQVVVLLLCIMTQSKGNELVIEKILSLECATQMDIKFYIEKTLANVNTAAVANGDMTSGESSCLVCVCVCV